MTTEVRHLTPTHPPREWQRIPHLGMILLSVDRATEIELPHMLPPAVAALHFQRVPMAATCNVASLRALEHDLGRAAADLLPGTPLDAIGFACTSGAIAIGAERVAATIGESHPGVPVTAPLTAARAALAALGASHVAVLTPYIDEVNALIADALQAGGYGITAFGSFHLDTDAEMSSVAPASLYDAALAIDGPAADALFISCTALHAAEVIAPLERATGKPVVTSHQAMLWHALALAGVATPIDGFGRLLAQPHRAQQATP